MNGVLLIPRNELAVTIAANNVGGGGFSGLHGRRQKTKLAPWRHQTPQRPW